MASSVVPRPGHHKDCRIDDLDRVGTPLRRVRITNPCSGVKVMTLR